MRKNKTWERMFFLSVGIAAGDILVRLFDYVLYPFVIWKLGLILGGVTMALLSLVACSVTLIFYKFTKKDWFGIELIKNLREYKGSKRILRLMSLVLKKGQFVSFIFLSVKFDPFTTTIYMRGGANEFPAMDKKSWEIFFASWFIGNLFWLFVVFTGVSVIDYIWHTFK